MQQYLDLLRDIKSYGVRKENRTGTATLAVFGRQLRFDLKRGFPLLTTKKIHTKSVIHELLWFLKGDTNVKYLKDNGVKIWNEWADENGELGPVYGKQWVDWTHIEKSVPLKGSAHLGVRPIEISINQVANVQNKLRENPQDRRMIVSAWNVADIPKMNLPPCHMMWHVYSEEIEQDEREMYFGKYLLDNEIELSEPTHILIEKMNFPKRKLSLLWYQRSNDVFLGSPFNIASYAFLTHMLAQTTNHVVGDLVYMAGDTHLYENHMEQVDLQLSRKPKKLPILLLNPNVKDIFDFNYEDFTIRGYDPHPVIKADIAV